MINSTSKWFIQTLLVLVTIGFRRKVPLSVYAASDDVYASVDDDWFYTNHRSDGSNVFETYKGKQIGFNKMVVMPLSCIAYNNADYIKFNFYEDRGWQCHANNLGTHLIKISNYMHAYFNQQAMELGSSFSLPWDAGYLTCVKLPETAGNTASEGTLYAKIGCLKQAGVVTSSNQFELHIYSDEKCSKLHYSSVKKNGRKDKVFVNGYWLSTKLSFSPNFYECKGCTPAQVAASFKKGNYWYDDDSINYKGQQKQFSDDTSSESSNSNVEESDDKNNTNSTDLETLTDDKIYFQANDDNKQFDDAFYSGNYEDDVNANAEVTETQSPTKSPITKSPATSYSKYWWQSSYTSHKKPTSAPYQAPVPAPTTAPDTQAPTPSPVSQAPVSKPSSSSKKYWWQYGSSSSNSTAYKASYNGNRELHSSVRPIELDLYHEEFWKNFVSRELNSDQRQVTWNFCERLNNHSFYCDRSCQHAVDSFFKDSWTNADVGVLALCITFISIMMCLIFTRRVKTYERAMVYEFESDPPNPGLPPVTIAMMFLVMISTIMVMANLNLVNQTLVFSMSLCVVLCIVFLKMSLFGDQELGRQPRLDYDMRKRIFDAGV